MPTRGAKTLSEALPPLAPCWLRPCTNAIAKTIYIACTPYVMVDKSTQYSHIISPLGLNDRSGNWEIFNF